MADVLAKVKKDLGPQAVILHTRTLSKGGVLGVGGRLVVEVTASKDVNVLPLTERRAIMGRSGSRPAAAPRPGDNGSRPSPSTQAEGAAVGRSPGLAPATKASPDLSAFTSALQGEMGELRGMIKELLARQAVGAEPEPQPDIPAHLREYYTCLLQNAVAEELAQEIIAKANRRLIEKGGRSGSLDELRAIAPGVMVECIEQALPQAQPVRLPADGATKYVALVGPTGVGKTTTIAKLAAHFKLRERKRVGLITIDTYRIAAVDQLRAYADILSLPLEIVLTPEEMSAALDRMRGCDLVLIDTSGRSQKDVDRLRELKSFLDVARSGEGAAPESHQGMETHLVLSCTSAPRQLAEVAEKFAVLGIDRVVFTKLDEAVGLGVILNTVRRLNLHLSYLTTGQDVPDDIEVGHLRRIAELVLQPSSPQGGGGTVLPSQVAALDHFA